MVSNGFIKLHRKILQWGWFHDHNTLVVFIYLLLMANYEEHEYRGIKLKPGQLVTGRKKIAEDLGLSEQRVRTALNHLKSTNEITIKSTNKFTVISVENWEKYQCNDADVNQQINQDANQQLTNNQPTTNQQLTTYKKEKKEKKEKNSIVFAPPTREEVRAYFVEKGFTIDPDFFFDYYDSDGWLKGNSRNGNKEPMKNWKQTAITWNKRANEKAKPESPMENRPRLTQEQMQRIAEEGRRRDREEWESEHRS